MIEENPVECIIVETGEEKALIPVYDDTIKEGLRVYETIVGGKFVYWKDPLTGETYIPGKEAHAKPQLPFELFGVECESGWNKLIQPLFDYIKNYNNENPDHPIVINQVKEKFGTLRFYVDNATPELKEMIRQAENDSHYTCEYCGDTTDVGITVDGWYTTLCRNCVAKVSKDIKRMWKSYNDSKTYLVQNGSFTVHEKK